MYVIVCTWRNNSISTPTRKPIQYTRTSRHTRIPGHSSVTRDIAQLPGTRA